MGVMVNWHVLMMLLRALRVLGRGRLRSRGRATLLRGLLLLLLARGSVIVSLMRWMWSIENIWNRVRYLGQILNIVRIDLILHLLVTVVVVPGELSVLIVLVCLLLALLVVHGVS